MRENDCGLSPAPVEPDNKQLDLPLKKRPVESKFEHVEIPRFIGIVAAISVGWAVSYHIGYFGILDSKLVAFFSVEDILRNSLQSAPLVIALWLARSIFLQWKRPSLSGKNHKARVIFRNPTGQFPLAVLIICTIYLFTDYWALYMLAYSFVVAAIVQDIIFPIKDDDKRFYFLDVFFLCFILSQAVLMGAYECQLDLGQNAFNYEVTFTDGNIVKLNVMRSGSQYLLVRDSDNSIRLLSHSEIRSISRHEVTPPSARFSIYRLTNWIWRTEPTH